jgi:hypothetical protein
MRRLNPTVLALLGGLAILLLLIAYFQSNRNPNQDRLTGNELSQAPPQTLEKRCAGQATYDLVKRELFRRAAQVRGSDQAVFDNLAGFAVARMNDAVMESEDSATGAVSCSGSLSLDLPPGVAVAGGLHTLTANIDYTVGASGNVSPRNADAIIATLATLARVAPPAIAPETNAVAPELGEGNVAAPESAKAQPGPPNVYPGRPSFDCGIARSRGEIAVCSDSGLSALDVNMAAQYRRALTAATPQQRALLQSTRDRFLAYRDRCANRQCVGDAYVGRMREIRDIMEGRLQPAR